MSEKCLYEVISPSDSVTFYAPNDSIARMVVLLVGEGKYGLTKEDGTQIDCMLLFMDDSQIDKKSQEWFGTSFGGVFDVFLAQHIPEVIDALNSFATMTPKERFMYDEAMKQFDRDGQERYRQIIQDKVRTSLNDICGRSWGIASVLSKRHSV